MEKLPSPLQYASVFAAFEATAKRFPQRVFFTVLPETAAIYGIVSGDITYGEMLAQVLDQQARYRAAGAGAGMRVGLLVENRPCYFTHWFALNGLGVSVVPINPDLRASELAYLVEHSEMALAVAIESRHKDLAKAGVTVISPAQELPALTGNPAAVDHKTESALLYTSGTTGLPKGCVLTNEYFLNCGDWYQNIGGACALHQDGERMLTPLPLFHMNAMACSVMGMIAVGGALTVLDRFHPSSWWDSVRRSRATVVHYLGVMPAMLMAAAPDEQDQAHSVRFGFGAGVEKQLHAPFEQRFGFPLVEAWAMTETGNGAVIVAAHGDRHVGSSCFGTPQPAVEVRLEDGSGAPVARGQAGELLVRHAGDNPRFGFFDHYLKNPQETAKAWEGGWFHTGDVVRENPDGSLVFVDRKKNVIRRSGENIAALEVESVLNRHPMVQTAAVAAVPDDLRGDEVFACIVAAADHPADPDEIMRWSLEQLAYYKAPGYIHFVSGLPLTSTNKIQRAKMKELVTGLMDHADTIDCRALKKRQKP